MDGLPFIDVPMNFGPINTFGILMALGVLLASYLARKYTERNGMDEETMRWLCMRLIVWGFIGAFALNTVFYEWDSLVADPIKTIKGLGISSYGALVAAVIAFFYYTGKRGLSRRHWGDMGAWGICGGWLLGRLGCAVVHDHLGHQTDFALAVNVPPYRYPFERSAEIIRAHDLGLYEFFVWAVLLVCVLLLERWKGRRPGFLLGFVAVFYSVPRFLFEYLRFETTDPRYFGLTFAQWSSVAFFAWGLWLLFAPVKPMSVAAVTGVPEPSEPAAPTAAKPVANKSAAKSASAKKRKK